MAAAASYENVTVNNRGGDISGVESAQQCQMQEANVVKAIHAVCVSADGREFPASHMVGDTWLDSSHSKAKSCAASPARISRSMIGDVVQSDQGMAGSIERGQVLECDVMRRCVISRTAC